MFLERRIAEIVSEFKKNWPLRLSLSELSQFCAERGLKWRKRKLPPAVTIQLLLQQILNGNTACSHLRHLAEFKISAMSYCKARMRLPLSILESLIELVGGELSREESSCNLWHGHRVWIADGTGCSMPDTEELRSHFGQPGGQKKGCGFPVASVLGLINCGTGALQKIIVSPLKTRDISKAAELHPEMKKGDVVVMDRGFCSYAHLALLKQKGIEAVIRVSESLKVNFRQAKRKDKFYHKVIRCKRLKKLGILDQLVRWCKPTPIPPWLNKEQFELLPECLEVRELRYRLNRRGYRCREITIVTTLVNQVSYPKSEIAELYDLRWEIETNFRHLKITLGMDTLRCMTVQGVLKELLAFYLIYNLVRLVMVQTARNKTCSPNRVSFIDALRWLLVENSVITFDNLILNPIRKGRNSPRVVKKRPKNYPRMTKPRNTFPGFLLNEQHLMA